ncbi:MAG: hypothetical protein PHU25_20435 [Deltaproteobacteria bacterium]|nr:hypothetical protein [Deltaproteobacteria bacterium]
MKQIIIVVGVALVLGGCGGENRSAADGGDAGTDSGIDAGTDSDTDSDSDSETHSDTVADAGMDAGDGGPDGGDTDADSDTATEEGQRACVGDDAYWVDPSGTIEGLAERCASDARCVDGGCTAITDTIQAQGKRFVLDGKEFFIRGINYFPTIFSKVFPEHAWLEDGYYNPKIVEDDLVALAGLGVNVVSTQTFSSAPSAASCANLKDFLNRCHDHGIFANLYIGNGNGAPDPAWITVIPETCALRDHPAIFAYDLAWEGFLGQYATRASMWTDWEGWLVERYGSLSLADTAFGESHAMPSDTELCATAPSVRISAFRRFADDHISSSYRRVREAMRDIDPSHLIGLRGGFGGNGSKSACPYMTFDLRAGAKHLSFISPEGYALSTTRRQVVLDMGGFTAAYADVGKPIYWAEFGVNVDGSCSSCNPSIQNQYFTNMLDMMERSGSNGGAGWWFVGIRPQNANDAEKSDYGIIYDYGSLFTSLDAEETPMRDGRVSLCTTAPSDYGLFVTSDDYSGSTYNCPSGLTGQGSFKPDAVAKGSGATGEGADGTQIEAGWMTLCAADANVGLYVLANDRTGEKFSCPAGMSEQGIFKPDEVPAGTGATVTDPLGRTLESGWVGLCVKDTRAQLIRTKSGLSGASYDCASGYTSKGGFKPNVLPLVHPVVATLKGRLPAFAPDTSRAYGSFVTVDRDLHAGDWKMYETGEAAFVAAGGAVGVQTACAGQTSLTAAGCIGNATGKDCPPKCLNAEWNRIEIEDRNGAWVRVEDGSTVEVASGAPVRARFQAGNTGEARWLKSASAGGAHGTVSFGCNESVGDVGCRIEILADTALFEDIAGGPAVISNGVTKESTVVFQMIAEEVAWFGDRIQVSLVPL